MNQWKRVWAFWAYTKSFHKAKQNKIEPTKNIMDRTTIAGISLNGRLLFIRQLHPVQFSIHATFNVRTTQVQFFFSFVSMRHIANTHESFCYGEMLNEKIESRSIEEKVSCRIQYIYEYERIVDAGKWWSITCETFSLFNIGTAARARARARMA